MFSGHLPSQDRILAFVFLISRIVCNTFERLALAELKINRNECELAKGQLYKRVSLTVHTNTHKCPLIFQKIL